MSVQQWGVNHPLTREQVKALPKPTTHIKLNKKGYPVIVTEGGFTPTSVGITGQQIKRNIRLNPWPTTNRAHTRGRDVQKVPIYKRDEAGNRVVEVISTSNKTRARHIVTGYKYIWHRDPSRLMNV